MSAAAYGDGLLGEVQEESLDELLRSLREMKTNHRPSTGIPAIDSILNVFLDPPQPRQRSQYHPHSDDPGTPLPPPPTGNPKSPPAVIEITGATPCSGKTQLLHLIIATAILPRRFHGSDLGGKGQAVVLLDVSHTFSILRLRDIMHNLILSKLKSSSSSSSSASEPTPAALSSIITSSLLHLHIFHPSSTPSLISTLSSLEPYLLPSPSIAATSTPHFSAARPLSLIALSNLSSFLWQDRLDADDASTIPSSTSFSSTSLLHTRYRHLTYHLTHLQTLLSCLIIATTSSPFPPSPTTPTTLRPHLPVPWPAFATVKLIVQRSATAKFEPGTSVEEAEVQRGSRWDVVREGRFVGGANWWGGEEGGWWREGWREGVRRLGGGGRFGFAVGGEGVEVLVEGM